MAKIVGMEAICANNLNKDSLFESVLALRTSVGADGLAALSDADWDQLKHDTPMQFHNSRCALLAFSGFSRALKESAWNREQIQSAGFIFSSTTSQIDLWENRLPYYQTENYDGANIRRGINNQSLGTPVLRMTDHFSIQGPRTLITSSCSASLQALAMALLWIKSGRVQRCIVGATEIHSTLTRVGFGSLRLLSKEICKPFDRNRTGINLGEGAGFICLEADSLRSEAGRGYLRGAGLSTDAYHPTSPHPEGKGSQTSLTMSLRSAGLAAEDIDWVYAHGTGSPANDLAESRAIREVFAHAPVITSTKASHGHTLSASGAIESVLGLLAMQKNLVLPTREFQDADSQIQLPILLQAKEQTIRNFVKNSLGFGGINASVIFSAEPGRH
ncbi:MAG: beta-ketoacyl-[acyl-carrier-protein] synthase family protein [Bdellovibrionaceae bacterium]|nr:beta-ketoacyl-[acyl-carrier-protein] synthase family protein [Pseudobdellovibrionaceae bacterium]